MFYVWVNNTMRVAGCNTYKNALYYATQYTDEGEVTVKKGNKIVARFSGTNNERIEIER